MSSKSNTENELPWLLNMGFLKRVNKCILIPDLESIKNMQDCDLLSVIENNSAPLYRRLAATQLYKRGEKIGYDEIVAQFIQYENPDVSKSVILETCSDAAVTLGVLKAYEATEMLFDSLDVLGLEAVYALHEMGSETVVERFEKMLHSSGPDRVYAVVAFALMKDERVITDLVDILDNFEEIQFPFSALGFTNHKQFLLALGGYRNLKADKTFKRHILASDFEFKYILARYVSTLLGPKMTSDLSRKLTFQLGERYEWKRHFRTKKKRYAILSFLHSYRKDNWRSYYRNISNPFVSDDEVHQLHDKVFQKIWNSLDLTD